MPHISKQKLAKDVEEQIITDLFEIFLALPHSVRGGSFLSEFFTQTERTVFAKRLAIMIMLMDDISSYRIAEVLKVSNSTVLRIEHQLERNSPEIQKALTKKKVRKHFWKAIVHHQQEIMERYSGKKRWDWLDDVSKKYKL